MSKNLTRKGLAFGALVALASSVISGAPASAAGSITLNPSTGTAWNTLSTSTFSVSPVITGVNADEYQYLRYQVTNPDELDLRVDIEQVTSGDGESTFAAGTTTAATRKAFSISHLTTTGEDDGTLDVLTYTLSTANHGLVAGDFVDISGITITGGDAGILTAANAADSASIFSVSGADIVIKKNVTGTTLEAADDLAKTATTAGALTAGEVVKDDVFVVAPDDTDSSGGLGSNANVLGAANNLIIDPLDSSKATTLKVIAWIDGNQNNIIDSGETVGAEQTIGFKKVSTLSASATLSGVLTGSSKTVTASVTLTGDINYQQVTPGHVKAQIYKAGTTTVGSFSNLSWDAATAAWSSNSGSITIAADEVYTVKVFADNDLSNSGTALIEDADLKGTFASTTVGATVVDGTFELQATNAANVVTTTSAQRDIIADGAGTDYDSVGYVTRAGTAYVRTGTTSFTVSGYVGSDAVIPVGAASADVSIAVGSTNVTNTDLVTVGGKAVTAGVATYTTSTDANGLFSFVVNTASADASDVLTFTATVTGVQFSSSVLTVNITDGTFAATQVKPGSLSIKAGDKVAVDYRVVDEFGVAPTNNTYSIVVTPTANERTTAATWSNTLQVVDGKASLSVTDNGVGNGAFVASAQLYKGASSVGSAITTTVNVVADPVAKTITAEKLTYGTEQAKDLNNDGDYADTDEVDNTAKLLVSTKTFGNYDSRYALPTDVAPTVTDATKVVVGGKVTNAAGTAIAGAPVTFAAKGFLFKSGTVYAQDTITVLAGSNGIASVEAWSQVGGSQSIAITSGAATAAQALVYAAGTTTAASHTVVTSAATVVPGRTLDVTVNVKDKFGNAAQGVAVALRSTGAGYLQASTGTTDAAGNVYVKLISGINDAGTSTIIATVTIAGVATEKSATVTVEAPAPAAVVAGVSGGTGSFNVAVTNAAGKNVVVKVAGKFFRSFAGSADKKTVALKAPKGSHKVTVYVGGKLVANKTVSVK